MLERVDPLLQCTSNKGAEKGKQKKNNMKERQSPCLFFHIWIGIWLIIQGYNLTNKVPLHTPTGMNTSASLASQVSCGDKRREENHITMDIYERALKKGSRDDP